MSSPHNLTDIYIEELQDLWSANDQMHDVVEKMADETSDEQLSEMLSDSAKGIQEHTDLLKELLQSCEQADQSKEHCKGMEGLVKEARSHAFEDGLDDDVRNVVIIAQYQRMTHYGIAGFGTAKAFADALGLDDDRNKLDDALEDIYQADDYASELAERSKNLKAKEDA